MRLSRQFQACLFIYFFLRKDFAGTKHVTSKNQITKQNWANIKQQRQQFFARTKTSKRVKIVYFAFWCFFYTQRFFVKKINWLEVVLRTSIRILLACTSINPSMGNLFVRTYFYLWSSVRISSFHENIFESFLSVRISFFCENCFESLLIYGRLWESIFFRSLWK